MPIFHLTCDKGHTWTEEAKETSSTSIRCPECKGADSAVSATQERASTVEGQIKDAVFEWAGEKGRVVQFTLGLLITAVGVLSLTALWYGWIEDTEEPVYFGLVLAPFGLVLVWKAVRGHRGS